MRVINAPYHGHIYHNEMAVFLAGGIKGCRDWQQEIIEHCASMDDRLILVNPRAGVFDSNDPECFQRQVEWEYDWLQQVDRVSFWFSKETVNPITLYELGFQMGYQGARTIFIGADPEYLKLPDVIQQTKLAGWEGKIVHTVEELGNQIIGNFNQWKFSYLVD